MVSFVVVVDVSVSLSMTSCFFKLQSALEVRFELGEVEFVEVV